MRDKPPPSWIAPMITASLRGGPSLCTILAATALCLSGCGRTTPPEESAAPAPVKWMEARQFFIEEWTDLLGTSQPLPEHAARVTAAVEGRVLSVLRSADGKPVLEGQWVKKGDVIVQLDDRI